MLCTATKLELPLPALVLTVQSTVPCRLATSPKIMLERHGFREALSDPQKERAKSCKYPPSVSHRQSPASAERPLFCAGSSPALRRHTYYEMTPGRQYIRATPINTSNNLKRTSLSPQFPASQSDRWRHHQSRAPLLVRQRALTTIAPAAAAPGDFAGNASAGVWSAIRNVPYAPGVS